jgi:hypothetical protein
MTIETKYNIGDEVWVIEDDKPKCKKIKEIDIQIGDYFSKSNEVEIDYTFGIYCIRDEKQCFPTKEELLKSL